MKKIFLLMALISLAVFYSCEKPINPIETDYVLLGGVKWAKTNLCKPKTFAKSNEETMYFQWNSKYDWTEIDTIIPIDTTVLYWEKKNDPCPDGWRVPNAIEVDYLMHLARSFGNQDGVDGVFLHQDEENMIFFPYTGHNIHEFYEPEGLDYGMPISYFWTNESYTSHLAISAIIYNPYYYMPDSYPKFAFTTPTKHASLPIRCVKEN